MTADTHAELVLRDECDLERAESTLELWAYALAEHGRDSDAAEAMRTAAAICKFRCGFLEREKQ